MATEFETQILNVDKEEIITKLRTLGAQEIPEVFQRRYVFDIKCLNATQPGVGEWIRLRDVGGKAELTYKNRCGLGMDETTELQVNVSDFDETYQILKAINFTSEIYYQENKRLKFLLNDLEFCLDTWPMIPVFLEIEGKSKESVEGGLELLGLTGKDAGHIGTINIYKNYGFDLHQYKELKF